MPSNDADGIYSVSWAAVSGATGYQLEQKIGSGVWASIYTGTGRSKALSGLATNTYQYRVKAKYGSVSGGYRTSSATYVVKTPGSITVPSNDADGAYSVSWAAVSGAAGYQLELKIGSGSWASIYTGTGRSKAFSDLAANTYQYRVKAKYGSISGGYRVSAVVTVLLPPLVPASLSVPTVTNINGVIELAWSASATATEYTLQEQKNGGAWESGTLAATSYTRTDRTNGNYIYRVRGCNASGCSGWRTSSSVTVLLLPLVPGSITVPSTTVTDGSVGIEWASVPTTTSYTLQESANNATWVTLVSQGSLSYEQMVDVDGSYKYRVKACNNSGCSDWKVSSNVTVVLPPAWRQSNTVLVGDSGGSNSAPSQSVNLNAAVLKGQASVSGGQASYQIPIDLPPGRAGIQPKVSLSYNSQSGNGLVGIGWSLNAGSAISRCGATYAQDGFTRAVTFNADTDRLCLNGQRLITSGSYGTSGTEYRTEMDSFVKVVQSGAINGASTSFTVHRPDGATATYGTNANSRFIPSDLTTTLSWKVTQESWSSGKNTLDYKYDTSVAGEHLLSKIYYTGSGTTKGTRYVEFNYEARNDNSLRYLSGGQLKSSRRLSQISTYLDSSNPVSIYELNHSYSGASSRSILTSVQQCGFENSSQQCAPPTVFNWADSQVVTRVEALNFGNGMAFPDESELFNVLPKGDANGDGVLDWSGIFVNAEGQQTGSHTVNINPCYKNRYRLMAPDCIAMDVNQDGLTDDWRNMNGQLQIKLTGGSWQQTGIALDESDKYSLDNSRLINSADYNGDSWPDLMVYHHNSGSPVLKLYLHSKNGGDPYSNNGQVVFNYPIFIKDVTDSVLLKRIDFMGDITGDGRPDLAIMPTPVGTQSWFSSTPSALLVNTLLANEGVSFTQQALSLGTTADLVAPSFNYFMDINGDGLDDWIGWQSQTDKEGIAVRFNLGAGRFASKQVIMGATLATRIEYGADPHTPEEQINRASPKYLGAFKAFDIDLDGKKELLVPGKRILEGCFKVYNRGVLVTRCGDALYGARSLGVDAGLEAISSYYFDDSIYQFDSISFEINEQGDVTSHREPTTLYGHAYQSAVLDIYGTGLPSMVFNHREQSGASFKGTASGTPFSGHESSYGIYVSRNFGSGTGVDNSDYAATDYLKSVTDGLGNTSQWRYRPLSTGEASAGEAKMYHTDHAYVGEGYIHFGSSMYVVQSFEQSNGLGGSNETEYAYKGAMYNLQGRGFTGFRNIIEKDVARNRVTSSTFKQKFPEVSLLESQTVSVNGTTVATTANTWADNPQHTITGVYHNINTRTITNSYGLSGSSERRSSVEQTVATADVTEYGNISKRTKTVTDYIDGGANSYQTVVETVFTPDTDNWFLRKFDSVVTTNTVESRDWANDPAVNADIAQVATQTVESWDETHHKPTHIVYTASGSTCSRSDVIVFNAYGLPTQVSVTGDNSSCGALTARTTSLNYTKNGSSPADDGYLPYQVTNAKGHISKTEYDMGLGVPTKVTEPNSIITQTQYDGIGRPAQLSQTGSPTRYLRYLLASNGSHAPAHAKLMTRTTSAGMPTQEVYLDSLGRPMRSATQAFDGSSYQYLDKKYDSLGHLTHESLPYYDGDAAEYTIFSEFDEFDRPKQRSLPNGESGGLISTYDYTGLKTNITVDGRTMSRTYGMQGWLYETVDAAGGSNRFAYDSGGRPLVIEDANSNAIVASYNGFGHKTQVDDPNQGITRFGYNSLGELDTQTDANGVTQTFTLDTLGRITSKETTGSNANGSASYIWDTCKQGLLCSETQNGISRSYAYNSHLQLDSSSVRVATSAGGDGVTRTVSHQYDSFYGRPKALTYPNGLTLEYRYNDSGYLNQTQNAASGYVYRTVTDMDAAGHLTGSQMASALLEQTSSYNSEGTMASTQVTSSLGLLHNHYYERYDSFMNLTAERNAVTGLEKSYVYDNLNRLKQYSFSNGGFAIYDNSTPFAATVDYGYAAVGNLLKKSDYSVNSANAYEYGACNGPNRVCAITKQVNNQRITFSYDSRGNLLVGDGLTMTYNALDKPLTISGRGPGNNTSTAFVYGSDNMRALQTRVVSGKTTKTHYVDKLFESDNDGSWRAYIDDVAVLSYTPEKSHQLLYTLRDRLGSATTMVDHNGNIISQRYFDPFGRTATASVAGSLGDLLDTNRNRRGFTDHEHLNEQQLIHMNGRVYDYNMGRFMSVDPFIQSPTSTQSVNPYSYIMNNPLAGTDPTGYVAEDNTMTGSRIKGVDTGASGAAFGAKAEMGSRKADSGASKSQTAQKADVQVDKIGSIDWAQKAVDTYGEITGTSGSGGEANLKINRLNDQIDAVGAAKAKESEYSITLVAHQDESIEFKGLEIPDVIGHAFVIMRGPNGEFAKGFWPSDGASFDYFISDTPLGGALSDEGSYSSRFKSWQATGKDPQGGQFAFRSFALTKAQYQNGVSAISNWNSTPYMGRSRMCGSFATHVLRATGQSYGKSKTPYYLFYDMGGSFDKN